jgi:hypothetical protein
VSRTTRNSKVLRSGAVGFLAGLATLGVVAHGSPARSLITDTTSSVKAFAGDSEQDRSTRTTREDGWSLPQEQTPQDVQPESQDQWIVPQDQAQPYAQPQYQQPQQPYAQPAPSQQPQSQAS